MIELMNFPIYAEAIAAYDSAEDLKRQCHALGCDGIEAVWGGEFEPEMLPENLALGYHLTFYPDWVDFWYGNETALLKKFGTKEAYVSFYKGEGKEALLNQFREDLDRAVRVGARYVVLHVSDVSLEEGYTYEWQHNDYEVMDAAIELANTLFNEKDYPFALLVENQWWPGFTFTDVAKTQYLLEHITYQNKGIMLDTGHLMNANTKLRTEAEGIAYIHEMLDAHGDLAQYIRGIHLHQSLSGAYVEANKGKLPKLSGDYIEQFGQSYAHILKIDQHEPWTDASIASVIERIQPEFLTHELSSRNRADRERAVSIQRETLRKGGK